MRRRDFVLLLGGLASRGDGGSIGPDHDAATADRALLEDLERRSFLYFWEQADVNTGLVLDRAGADGGRATGPSRDVASSAATGFGLTALCIGANHGWVTREQAAQRVRSSFRFLANHAYQEHGWFYHWMDAATGERTWASEVSSIDTAFLLAGVLTAAQFLSADTEIQRLSKLIYDRIDFPWMLNGDPLLLSHGWRPEKGFLKYQWDTYSELALLYLLAIGSRTRPIAPESWYRWQRPLYHYGSYQFISGGPLFTHQYSHAWVDFRKRRDGGFIDFFENSVAATRSNRLFCGNLNKIYPQSFDDKIWGVTASDSRKGYKIYGEISNFEPIDGTIAPCGAGGSLMFTPDISVPALRGMRDRWGERVYRRYGFVDAFNPGAEWFDDDVIGIDAGITLLSAENLLTGNVWRWFMSNGAVPRAMDLLGFTPAFSSQSTPTRKSRPIKRLHGTKASGFQRRR